MMPELLALAKESIPTAKIKPEIHGHGAYGTAYWSVEHCALLAELWLGLSDLNWEKSDSFHEIEIAPATKFDLN